MKKIRVILDFLRFSIGDKIVFYRNVIAKLTGNPVLPTPDVMPAVLTTLTDTLEEDSVTAQGGAHAAIARLYLSEQAADEAFRKVASYVDRTANGNAAIILDAGFHTSKQPEPAIRPLFSAEVGKNPGEIALTRKAVPEARSYVWQNCVGPLPTSDKAWIFAGASTQTRFVVTGLESGSKCWFRVAAVTPAGMGPWSEPIMKVVP